MEKLWGWRFAVHKRHTAPRLPDRIPMHSYRCCNWVMRARAADNRKTELDANKDLQRGTLLYPVFITFKFKKRLKKKNRWGAKDFSMVHK